MPLVRLICWKQDLARDRELALEGSGFRVDSSPLNTSGVIGHFRANPPQLVLIDLDRLPSHGREVATALRQSKATRHIPIVFAGGPPEKVERIRRELPDAVYTEWRNARTLKKALNRALRNAPAEPARPTPHMERYAGSSLVKKLGLAKHTVVALLGAPEDFAGKLGELPEGCELLSTLTRAAKLVIWFVRSRRELEAAMEQLSVRLPEKTPVWIAHPKQAGRYRADFNQNDVRAAGLGAGLVDYKVCAIDADWSGLKFASPRRSTSL
jgi:CheY-like chemotaxis protein